MRPCLFSTSICVIFFLKIRCCEAMQTFSNVFLILRHILSSESLVASGRIGTFFLRLNNFPWHTSTHTYVISNGKHIHILYIHRCIYTHAYVSCIHRYIHTPLYVMRYNSLSSHPLTPKLILCLVHNMVAVQWGADVF